MKKMGLVHPLQQPKASFLDSKHFADMAQNSCPQGGLAGVEKLSPEDIEAIFRKSL